MGHSLVSFDFPILAGAQSFELALHLVERVVGAILKIDEFVARGVDAPEDLVELEVQGARVAVLSVLHQEHHEKGDDGGAGVDDQLPGIGVAENRPGDGPQNDEAAGGGECVRCPELIRCLAGDFREIDVALLVVHGAAKTPPPSPSSVFLERQPLTSCGICAWAFRPHLHPRRHSHRRPYPRRPVI